MAANDLAAEVPGVMVPPPVIVFTANNRPLYMRRVLASWRKSPGIAAARMLFLCEPGCPDMVAECERARDFCGNVTVTVNKQRRGPLSNPWHAFEAGFALADFVVVAEDDTIVSPDALAFFAAAAAMFAADDRVIAVFPFRHHAPEGARADGIEITTSFESTIWATWKDRWDGLIRDSWDHDYSRRGFDWNLQRIVDEKDLRVVQPQISRAQHIGQFNGSHMQPHQHASLQSRCFDPGSHVTAFRLAGSGRPARRGSPSRERHRPVGLLRRRDPPGVRG